MRKQSMHLAVLLPTLALVVACGPGGDSQTTSEKPVVQTAYGTLADVQAYLDDLNPQIAVIGALNIEYEQGLASARSTDASRRHGTGRNLAERAAQVRPRLQAVLEALSTIQPPPLLAPFHRDTRKMVAARLEAYAKNMEGWEIEQVDGAYQAVYSEAETKLQEANRLILQLNEEMTKINAATQAAAASASAS